MDDVRWIVEFFGPLVKPVLLVVGAFSIIVWWPKMVAWMKGRPIPGGRTDTSRDALIARLMDQNDRSWKMLAEAINNQTEVLRANGEKLDEGFSTLHRRIDLCPHKLPEPRP